MERRALETGVRAAPALVPPVPHAQPCEPHHAGLRWADPTCSSLISTRRGDGVPRRRVRLGTCVCSATRDDREDEKVSASRFASAPPPWTAAQAQGPEHPADPTPQAVQQRSGPPVPAPTTHRHACSHTGKRGRGFALTRLQVTLTDKNSTNSHPVITRTVPLQLSLKKQHLKK